MLYFICEVVGSKIISIQDAKVICAHAPGKCNISVDDLITYCRILGWIQIESDRISLSPALLDFLSDNIALNDELIKITVAQLFKSEIINSTMFFYDSVQCCYAFKNEFLPLSFSTVRNMLIGQGFFVPIRDLNSSKLYISSTYDSLIAEHCRVERRQISLEQLKKQLVDNELAGEKAELFVLDYEKKRIGKPLCDKIKRISEIDVAAGYDIVSFNFDTSQMPDRFIEVKAISNVGFYWSKNEYEIAKLKGKSYYLYLVELNKINNLEYSPEIINNPAEIIINSDKWFIEPQGYHIIKV